MSAVTNDDQRQRCERVWAWPTWDGDLLVDVVAAVERLRFGEVEDGDQVGLAGVHHDRGGRERPLEEERPL